LAKIDGIFRRIDELGDGTRRFFCCESYRLAE
jgi:hypothetical protein